MARQRVPAPESVSDQVAFEVENFGWTAEDRLVVTGRWYGLRGHRFVRPVLMVHADDDDRRMLAVLDHKPWAADDGEEWIAAFPWEGEPIELASAELAVAPTLAVDLPAPLVPGRRGRAAAPNGPLPARAKPGDAAPAPATASGRSRSRSRARPAPAAAQASAGDGAEAEALRAQLATEQATVRRLASQLDDAHQGLAAARSTADERDALERERDAAVAARDEALARANLDHDSVIEERDAASHERSAALHERDEALDQRAAANFERKSALAERDAALAERDRAVEAHRKAVRELEALERKVRELEHAIATPPPEPTPAGAVPVVGPPDPSLPPEPVATRRAIASRRPRRETAAALWIQRALALVLLVVWALVVYKVLHGVL
jgi:hypothetical protein